MYRNRYTHKNIKLLYYLKGVYLEVLTNTNMQFSIAKELAALTTKELETVKTRLKYYCNIDQEFSLTDCTIPIHQLKRPKRTTTYYFDLIEYTRYFNTNLKLKYLFGDIVEIPELPTLVKSRPILGPNENSILFKFNKIRHFTFTDDRKGWATKKDALIGRANVKQEHRRAFYRKYFEHPLCDLGQINKNTTHDQWYKPKITIKDHLKYKFILCLEGNDVASNLKWVMSSNSLAVMPKPKFETWFMEGHLKPNEHYVAIKDDYSDLEERLEYYLSKPQAAIELTQHANAYVRSFRNAKIENVLCYLVLEKYFVKSGQMKPLSQEFYN